MAEQVTGKVEILNSASNITITLNGNTGDISAGGSRQDGDIILKDGSGNERIRIDAQTGTIIIKASDGQNRLRVDGNGGNIWMGGNGADGDLVLFRSDGDNATLAQATIHLDGQGANAWLGGNGSDGDVVLFPSGASNINDAGQATVHLDGQGNQILLKVSGQNRVRVDGNGGNIWLGGNGADGDLVLFRNDGDNATLAQATIHLDGQGANAWLGGHGSDGDVVLFPSSATNINDLSQASIHLDGQSGDIKLSNADCAEEFDVPEAENIEPGTIMVLSQDGQLEQSIKAYDKKVVGVVSGAGEHRPGIVLDKRHSQGDRIPIALMGKAYCRVDAQYSPIEIGDLLTTSPTPGHAMKAEDPLKAFGAVIGKALQGLKQGHGLIPILIALQ
jgi:hypothetical protein